jgi:hypothetical protein
MVVAVVMTATVTVTMAVALAVAAAWAAAAAQAAAAAAAERGAAQQFGGWKKDWCTKKKGAKLPLPNRTVKPRDKIGANLPAMMRRTDQSGKSARWHKKRFPSLHLV